ncbi:hypothetical protein [Streptomyces sp. SID3343]|uniref:hypothetical protein n=1 Tax=Streptomyces sp. SID3343 TaxID=2690260 RepID=UPI00136D49DA|nr:hypothetical protein [Streptomyces sp. SID3343]
MPAESWLCGVTTWEQVWADPSAYVPAVAMSPPQRAYPATGEVSADGSRALLYSAVPLKDAIEASGAGEASAASP